VAREIALPGEERGVTSFALDHLLLDQDGVPILVEVKRLTDTRIRREVVGQMLDYAGRAGTGWTADWLRERHAERCRSIDIDPDSELADFLELDREAERFWSDGKAHLDNGRVRLIFLADVIAADLRRVIEFLNRQMNPAEVLAIEIRQFAGGDTQLFVPRLFGQTVATLERKTASAAARWDEDSFFRVIAERSGEPDARVARVILDWAKTNGSVWWGRGTKDGSFGGAVDQAGIKRYLFAVYTYGPMELYFQWLKHRPPFDSRDLRLELLRRLNAAVGTTFEGDAIERRPSLRLATLAQPAVLAAFLSVMDWAVDTIRHAPASPDGQP
jgi:hypothetical protein